MSKLTYSDVKELIPADKIQARIRELGSELNELYNGEEVCVICVLKGSVMFAADLVREFNFPVTLEFIRLSSYGSSTTTSGKVHAIDIKLPILDEKNVLIVEDIVDTGLTAKFLLEYISSNFNTKSTKFVSLLDKKISRKVELEPDYYGFEIDDKFVVGYGLDYDGYFRNLKYVGYINPDIL